jgi:hypothetical protein
MASKLESVIPVQDKSSDVNEVLAASTFEIQAQDTFLQ